MSENTDLTYYQRNRDLILNKKDYYKSNKERLREEARDKYKSLSEEQKNKKRECRKKKYRNISEEKKQILKECQKEYQKNHDAKKDIIKKKLPSIMHKTKKL